MDRRTFVRAWAEGVTWDAIIRRMERVIAEYERGCVTREQFRAMFGCNSPRDKIATVC